MHSPHASSSSVGGGPAAPPSNFSDGFRRLWLSRTLSYAGDAGMPVTISLAVIRSGGGAGTLGAALGLLAASRVVFSIPAGALSDRLGRRQVLMVSDAALAVLQLVTGVFLLAGRLPEAALVASIVIYGALAAPAQPALVGLVAQTTRPSMLARANSRLSLSNSLTRLAAPALAGVVAGLWSPGWYYLGDAISSALAMLVLIGLSVPRAAKAGERQPNLRTGVVAGFREARARPWYLRSLAAHSLGNFAFGPCLVLGPLVATQQLGGPAAWGVVASGAAVGAVVGGLVVGRYVGSRPLVWGNLACGLVALESYALAVPVPVLLVTLAAALGALGIVYLNEIWNTVLQVNLPLELLSNLSALDWATSLATLPLGMWLAAYLSQFMSASILLGASGVLGVASAGAGALMRSVRQLRLDDEFRPQRQGGLRTRPAAPGRSVGG